MTSSDPDLSLALMMADAADVATLSGWSTDGVASTTKSDGSPVTDADRAAEQAVLEIVLDRCPGDGFLGEETGSRPSLNGRRWIIDGIDGTRNFADGLRDWGTLIALEEHGVVTLGVVSSPAQNRRWWAKRGVGAFRGSCSAGSTSTPISVSTRQEIVVDRVVTLPVVENLSLENKQTVVRLVGSQPSRTMWSHQLRVAEGEIDLCIWFCGDTWDHAAPSVIVEAAGGRFTDHAGGQRLDTRTGLYSNGRIHDQALNALSTRKFD